MWTCPHGNLDEHKSVRGVDCWSLLEQQMVFYEKFLYFRPRNMIPKTLDQGTYNTPVLYFGILSL